MKKVLFVYNPGNTLLIKTEEKVYEDCVPDTRIEKDYEEWLLEQAEANGKSYWEVTEECVNDEVN